MRPALLLPAAVLVVGAVSFGGASGPAAPSVAGPRQTASQEPTYVFRARGAARFLCAFDSSRLHACPARYSEWLAVGAHVLRVRAVSASGRSRVVSVRVRVVSPSGLYTDARVQVGAGAGVPAVDAGSVWVPNTRAGTLSRVDVARGKVAVTLKLGAPPRFTGYLDAAVAAGGSIWAARDVGGEIVRVDPATNRIRSRIPVESRPGGLAVGGGFVWAFHFEGDTVTRIDAETGAKASFRVPGALGTGIAYADGTVWLLTEKPSFLVKLDPADGDVLARVAVAPATPAEHGIVDTWWVAAGGGSLWVVNPNHDRVTRVDAATARVVASIPVPLEIPFGVTFFDGSAWVAGAGKVVRIAPETNAVTGTVVLSLRSSPVFTQVAGGESGLWATDYDAGVLYRIHVP